MAGRTRASSNSPTGHNGTSGLRNLNNREEEDVGEETGDFKYESLIGGSGSPGDGGDGQDINLSGSAKAVDALSNRLTTFRDWLVQDAGATVHPSICIVNGEATDGTKNAPVLAFGPPPGSQSTVNNQKNNPANGRVGLVDTEVDRALYDRTMGCCVRTTKEIKKDEVILTVPRSAMVTPDLVAYSDAGKAVLACCQRPANGRPGFWDAFENTTICEQRFTQKVQRNTGPQLIVKILHERKRAHTAYTKAVEQATSDPDKLNYTLAPFGSISTRAPLLAFLIHQRFSDSLSPPVSSDASSTKDELDRARESSDGNALRKQKETLKPPNSPATFAPYVRTLPSAVSLPLSWKRNELAFLSGCIPGTGPLQEVAARTLQLAAEFVTLLESGILHRFPSTFPEGLITWERWMWAASCVQSRMLPATCYLNKGGKDAPTQDLIPANRSEFQSPPAIWNELGVMVPLLDMLNHEIETHQVTWEPCVPSKALNGATDTEVDNHGHPPRAILHARVRKGSQVYCAYGALSNDKLLVQYGFAQLGNPLDKVRLGWGLADAVGGIDAPSDYKSPFEKDERPSVGSGGVYDTTDQEAIKAWWTEDRLAILEREAFKQAGDSFASLKNGKKMMASAYGNGDFHPILLTVAVVATMPTADVEKNLNGGAEGGIELSKSHQRALRNYLVYTFARKLEKLLHNLQEGLKAHFAALNLWTRASEGGLRYNVEKVEGVESEYTGWQTFFDQNAYTATLEAENQYYALGADTCTLALCDGQLRSLQASIDGLESIEKFQAGVLRQLKQLDFKISTQEEDIIESDIMVAEKETPIIKAEVTEEKVAEAVEVKLEETRKPESHSEMNGKMEVDNPAGHKATIKDEEVDSDIAANSAKTDMETEGDGKDKEDNDSKLKVANDNDGDSNKKEESKKHTPSKSSRRRNKRKNAAAASSTASTPNVERPPAIKLHIGNLAYSTTPSTLFEFFATMCGRENVLECHIPTERDSGRSRGFGFVTLPEPIARNILKSGKKYEVDNRPLKIAESNSAGSGKSTKLPPPPPMAVGERCSICGYRPKYCVCRIPNIPGFAGGPPPPPPPPPPPHMHPHGPPMDMVEYGRDYDLYGGGGGRRFRDERFGHSSSPYDRPSRPGDRDRSYGRESDRDQRGYRYDKSRSRSYERGDGRMRERGRRDGGKVRQRSRSRFRSESRSPRGSRRGRERDPDKRWGRHRSSSCSRSRSYSSGSSRSLSPHSKRDHDPVGQIRSKDKKVETSLGGGKEPNEDARGTNASSANKARDNRKRTSSHSRGGGSGSRKKKKSKRRSTRSRSRSRSPSANPRGD
jgi:RNA recognition motif. (a.k.a. RRM, RBD, or RNP domain)/SET domain